MRKNIITLMAAMIAALTAVAQTPTHLGIGIANPEGNLHIHSSDVYDPPLPPINPRLDGFTTSYQGILHMTNSNTGTMPADGFSIKQLNYDVTFQQHENGWVLWQMYGNGQIWFLNNGRVGIGDTTVGYKLAVGGNTKVAGNLNVGGNTTLGGTAGVTGSLNVGGGMTVSDGLTVGGSESVQGHLSVNGQLTTHNTLFVGTSGFQATTSGSVTVGSVLNVGYSGGVQMTSSGNITASNHATFGSATIGSGFNCDAQGNLKVKQLRVTLTDWPDYVFGEGYRLMPLGEVEEYIGENGHLPQMPSAAEVEADGADLGEMNRLLLQKVEELTLYIIDLQKQVDELKSNNTNK